MDAGRDPLSAKEWTRIAAVRRVHVPTDVRFRRMALALTLLRRAARWRDGHGCARRRAYGDVTVFRETLHRLDLPYAVAFRRSDRISGTPRVAAPVAGVGAVGCDARPADHEIAPIAVSRLAAGCSASVARDPWRTTSAPVARGVCRGPRDTGAEWRRGRLAGDLAPRARPVGSRKISILLHSFVRDDRAQRWSGSRPRWAIERVSALKDELGLDPSRARYPGWTGTSRSRRGLPFLHRNGDTRGTPLTFPMVRAS